MSSHYQKQFTIPEGLPQLLKDFSREVLRHQPENIYVFGAHYFADLLTKLSQPQQDSFSHMDGDGDVDLTVLSAAELGDYILQLFLESDIDRNGYLDPPEFFRIMASSRLGLNKRNMRKIMAECDENDDGVLEYREFLPIMVQVIHGQRAKSEASDLRDASEEEAKADVEVHLLRGVPREELEDMMRNVFRAADVDGNGTLDHREFKRCLKSADMGFTRQEVNILLAEADRNGDGTVSYEEFMPLCFSILVERFAEELLSADASRNSADELAQTMLARFAEADAEQTGTLSIAEVKGLLQAMSREELGLTRLQILCIMSEADPDPSGNIKYERFVPTAAHMIHSMVDMSSQAQRAAAIEAVSRTQGALQLHGHDRENVKQIIHHAFLEADADKSGALDRAEVLDVLHALGSSELNLRPQEIASLLAAMDENDDGLIHYSELIDFMLEVLLHLEREAHVQRLAWESQQFATGELGGEEHDVEGEDMEMHAE